MQSEHAYYEHPFSWCSKLIFIYFFHSCKTGKQGESTVSRVEPRRPRTQKTESRKCLAFSITHWLAFVTVSFSIHSDFGLLTFDLLGIMAFWYPQYEYNHNSNARNALYYYFVVVYRLYTVLLHRWVCDRNAASQSPITKDSSLGDLRRTSLACTLISEKAG